MSGKLSFARETAGSKAIELAFAFIFLAGVHSRRKVIMKDLANWKFVGSMTVIVILSLVMYHLSPRHRQAMQLGWYAMGVAYFAHIDSIGPVFVMSYFLKMHTDAYI